MSGAQRSGIGACAWLVLVATACTALVDQELAGKARTAGSAGAGADGDGTGGSGAAPAVTGTTCPAECTLSHATASCSMGACDIVDCDPGFADCNHERLDGCEVDLLHDSERCGKCHHACKNGESCEEGQCT